MDHMNVIPTTRDNDYPTSNENPTTRYNNNTVVQDAIPMNPSNALHSALLSALEIERRMTQRDNTHYNNTETNKNAQETSRHRNDLRTQSSYSPSTLLPNYHVIQSQKNTKKRSNTIQNMSTSINGSQKKEHFNNGKLNDTTKKRKRTTNVRKEEKEVLTQEIRRLQAHLNALKRRAGMPSDADETHLENATKYTECLREVLREQQLAMAGLQSILHQNIASLTFNPMEHKINLTRDPKERHEVLAALKEPVFQHAEKFFRERFRGLAEDEPYASQEHHVDANGAFCFSYIDQVIFEDEALTVKQVFDIIRDINYNMEISISETLGHLTMRDDYATGDDEILYFQLVSSHCDGVTHEMKRVEFVRYENNDAENSAIPENGSHKSPRQNGMKTHYKIDSKRKLERPQEMGIIAGLFVDEDEMYPYSRHDDCAKIEVTPGFLVTSYSRRKCKPGQSSRVIVVKRYRFVRMRQPGFPLPRDARINLMKTLSRVQDMIITRVQQSLEDSST